MKASQIRKCSLCGKGVMHHGGVPSFWAVKINRYFLDVQAIQQRHGLEMLFGGGEPGAALAEAMGPNQGIAKPIDDEIDLIICEPCGINERLPVAVLAEATDQSSGTEK